MPDQKAIRALACCWKCYDNKFFIRIYSSGDWRIHCSVCDTVWEEWPTARQGFPSQPEPDQAMAQGRDESGNVVSQAEALAESMRMSREKLAADFIKREKEE